MDSLNSYQRLQILQHHLQPTSNVEIGLQEHFTSQEFHFQKLLDHWLHGEEYVSTHDQQILKQIFQLILQKQNHQHNSTLPTLLLQQHSLIRNKVAQMDANTDALQRVSVSFGCNILSKASLSIGIRYALSNKKVGLQNKELLLIDDLLCQRRLFPHLAFTYALHFANEYLTMQIKKFGLQSHTVQNVVNALKVKNSTMALECIQTVKECCGQVTTPLEVYHRLADDYCTVQGDNTVLLSLVGKYSMEQCKAQFDGMDGFERASEQGAQFRSELKKLSIEFAADPKFYLKALEYREFTYRVRLLKLYQSKLKEQKEEWYVWNECSDLALKLGEAYSDRILLEQFVMAIQKAPKALQPMLQDLCNVLVFSHTLQDPFFFEYNYIANKRSRVMNEMLNECCKRLRPFALDLVNAFDIPNDAIGSSF